MVPAELIESLIEREVGDRVICTYDYCTKQTLSDEILGYVHAHPVKILIGTTLGLTLTPLVAHYCIENLSWASLLDIGEKSGAAIVLLRLAQNLLGEKSRTAVALMRLTQTLLGENPERNAKREFKKLQRNIQRYQTNPIPVKNQIALFKALNLVHYLPRTTLETDQDQYLLANLVSRVTEQLYDQTYVSQPTILKLDLHKKQAALDGDEQLYLPTVRKHPQYRELFEKIVAEDFTPKEMAKWMKRHNSNGTTDLSCKLSSKEIELLEELCNNTLIQFKIQGGQWDGRRLEYGLLSPTSPGKGVGTRMGSGESTRPLLVYPTYAEGTSRGNFAVEKMESGIFIGVLGEEAAKDARGGIIITEHVPKEIILKHASDNKSTSRKPLIVIGPQGIESTISPDFEGLVIGCGEEISQVSINARNIHYKNELIHTGFPDRHALTSIIRNYEEYWQMRKDGHVAFDDSITRVFDDWIQRSQKFIDL